MKMLGPMTFICHSYGHFSLLSHIFYRQDMTFRKKSDGLSSVAVSKITHAGFSCLFLNFSIISMHLRMVFKENHRYSVFLFLALILRASNVAFECRRFLKSRVAFLLRVRF